MKKAGYIVGGSLLAVGVASLIIGALQDKYQDEVLYVRGSQIEHIKYYNEFRETLFYVGFGAMATGAAVGVPLIVKGSSLQKKSRGQIQSASAISHDIDFGNGTSLNVGVDVLSNSLSYIKIPGIGVRYNF